MWVHYSISSQYFLSLQIIPFFLLLGVDTFLPLYVPPWLSSTSRKTRALAREPFSALWHYHWRLFDIIARTLFKQREAKAYLSFHGFTHWKHHSSLYFLWCWIRVSNTFFGLVRITCTNIFNSARKGIFSGAIQNGFFPLMFTWPLSWRRVPEIYH